MDSGKKIKHVFFGTAVIAALLLAVDILYFVVLQWGQSTRGIDTTNQLNAFMFSIMPRISTAFAFIACVLGVYYGVRVERNVGQKSMLFLSLLVLLVSISAIPQVID
ncbi:hypothetical protein [Pseudoalteromonas peptidolytica]|uniref:hypothetical protein n=1 Tax=Pseudoalteromonas peptidolytica TaxID=61150 RepID=UPI001167E055|nr:hypothetical protein [Pseudoalteromonas peptidolytica]NLR14677.1 hypothetical protein [Pseudoalteromonas peptidolytica]GEK08988.1 hypothetical protein PPE03_12370 [Pseudoalteromonas peptidolytica]